jgi:hypothetical protein
MMYNGILMAKKMYRQKNESNNIEAHELRESEYKDDNEYILLTEAELLKFAGSDTVVSIFSDCEDTNKFSSGMICAVSDRHVLLAHISPAGFEDGFMLRELGCIYGTAHGGEYEKKIKSLYGLRQQSHPSIDCGQSSLLIDLLSYAREQRLVVTLELYHSDLDDFQGYVADADGLYVRMDLVDDCGLPNGNVLLDTGAITHAVCDSDREKSLKLLSESGQHLR